MGLASQALADKSQRWWTLSSIQIAGGIISLPVIAIGSEILSSGLTNALISIFLGNLLILVMGYLVILMSYKHRLNAVENAEQFIGNLGGRILAFCILMTTIGWIGWELSAGQKFLKILPFFSEFNPGALIGVISSLILLVGIKGVKILCNISILPLIILFFLIIYFIKPSYQIHEYPLNKGTFDLVGVSLVVSSSVSAVVDYPTFFRHSKSKKDSFISIVVIFIVTVIMQVSGILLFKLFYNDLDISNIIAENDIHSIILVLFLILSMIASICWNIYSASVGWESLFPAFKDRTEYALIGLVATVLISYVQLQNAFSSMATICDAITSSLGGVLIFEFIKNRKNINLDKKSFFLNSISWLTGSILGILTYFNFLLHRNDCIIISLMGGFLMSALLGIYQKIHREVTRR